MVVMDGIPFYRNMVRRSLAEHGHNISAIATDDSAVEKTLTAIENDELECSVIVVGSNLTRNGEIGRNMPDSDVIDNIRRRNLGVRIVHWSHAQPPKTESIDAHISKLDDPTAIAVAETIDEL